MAKISTPINIVLSIIFVFAAGILVGRYLPVTANNNDKELFEHADRDQLKAKFQALTDRDIAEYYQLKEDAEKFKKADEILAQIMTIFLNDLGIKLAKPSHLEISTTLSKLDNAVDGQEALAITKAPLQNKPQVAIDDFRDFEGTRNEIKTESDIDKFLEDVKIDNLDESLKETTNYKNRTNTLDVLSGTFSGKSTVKIDEKFHTWDVEISVNASFVKDELNGKVSVKMAENGKKFSQSNDGGNIRSLREFSVGSDAILVRASPIAYFQLYYVKQSDSLLGNVYRRKTEEDPFRFVGTIQLHRN